VTARLCADLWEFLSSALPCPGVVPGPPARHVIRSGLPCEPHRYAHHDLAGRPVQRPAAEDVRVYVVNRLAGVVPGVEHHPVAGLCHACLVCHQRRLSRDLVKQPIARLRNRGQVLMVLFRYHQNVQRRLRVYVLECDSARAFKNSRRRDLPRRDATEQAISHAEDLNRCPA
jgi:hypothetical protein